MEIIDNVNKTLKEDLTTEIHKGSKVSIAAACFSIYAFAELKKEFKNVDELRFIFTSPTFIKEKAKREKREFYIPRQEREKNLFGSEFEVKLRNEMTQKAIAKECAEWIHKKAVFKSNVTNENMMGFINVDDKNYMPLSGFTTVDLGCERGNNAYYMVQKSEVPMSIAYLQLFEQIWNDESKLQKVTDEVIENITTVYNENSPDYLYFVTLYNIFNEFLEDVSEDVLPNEATGFKESKIWGMLYNFQKDAALAIINKLEKYNGCILADSVGLGKTFTALSVIKYYENRNKSVLVLCPKKLANNWNTYKYNYINNPIAADRMRYDVLFHTDLSRESGNSNGMDLDMVNWGNYDLMVIDESHNFRNGGKISGEDEKENRYLKLLNKVIRKGVKTKVLMLSATPVNNRFVDLKIIKENIEAHIKQSYGKKVTVEYVFDISARVQEIEKKCGEKYSSVYYAENTMGCFLPDVKKFPYYILILQNRKDMLDVMTAFHEYRHLLDYLMFLETVFKQDTEELKHIPLYITFNVYSEYNATAFGVKQYIEIVKFDDLDKHDIANMILNKAKETYWNLQGINNRYQLLVHSMQYLGNIVACIPYINDIDLKKIINDMELSKELIPVINHILAFQDTTVWYTDLNFIMRNFVDGGVGI